MSKSHVLIYAHVRLMLKKISPASEYPLGLSVNSDLDGLGFA